MTGQLWSAQILREKPAEIVAAHADFFDAGAQVATTCSYQVSADGLAAAGGNASEAEGLLRRSVDLARDAAQAAEERTGASGLQVAASLGPYGAGPGAGDEYDGAYGRSVQELREWHRPRIEVLASTAADFLLAETVPSMREVEAIALELQEIEMPAMLSVTVEHGQLRGGGSLKECAQIAAECRNIVAIGVNCCSTLEALAGIRLLAAETDIPLSAYPNSGETWDAQARSWKSRGEGSASLLESVNAFADAGVSFLGGCCRVTPREIAAISQQLRGNCLR